VAKLREGRTFVVHPDRIPARWGDPSQPLHAVVGGDYTYLTEGYYRALDLEQAGVQGVPTPAGCLDAYVVPIALSKAERAGLRVPKAQMITDRFIAPPLLAYPVNPFSSRGELLPDAAAIETRRRGLTYTGKYAVYCQALPPDFRIDVVRVVFGRTTVREYHDFAEAVWATFAIPLMRVRTIVVQDAYLFSAIEPLPLKQLTPEERTFLEEAGSWRD
jgi:hypothetical protein